MDPEDQSTPPDIPSLSDLPPPAEAEPSTSAQADPSPSEAQADHSTPVDATPADADESTAEDADTAEVAVQSTPAVPDDSTPADALMSTPAEEHKSTPAEAEAEAEAEADNSISAETDQSPAEADDTVPPLSQAAPNSPLPAQVDSNPASPTPKPSPSIPRNPPHIPLTQEENSSSGKDPVDTSDPQSAQDQDDQDGDQTTRLLSDPLLAQNKSSDQDSPAEPLTGTAQDQLKPAEPLTSSAQDQDKPPPSSQQTSALSVGSIDDPNRKTPVDFNSSEVVQALQPSNPGQEKSPASRRTPIRNLPKMLRDFQNSRDTLYFTEGGLQEIQQFADANPNLIITNDELVSLLEKAKNTHVFANLPPDHTGSVELLPPSLDSIVWPPSASGSGSQHSLRVTNPDPVDSADSPSTPGGWPGRNFPRPKDPFSEALSHRLANLSDDGGSVPSEPDSPLKNASSRQAKRDPAPGPHPRQDRPMPPRRKKKSPPVKIDTQPESSKNVFNPYPDPLSIPFPDDPDSPGTRENFLETMTKLKQGDLHPSEPGSEPGTDESELSANELFRRLRPGSDVFPRTFESTDSAQYKPPDVDRMYEDYPLLQKAYSGLRRKALEMEQLLEHQERLHEEEMVKMSDKIDELSQEVASRTKGEREEAHTAYQQRIHLETVEDEIEKAQKELESVKANYSKIKLKWEEAVDDLDKVRTNLREREEELRTANRAIQYHNSDMRAWDTERRLLKEHIESMQLDVLQLQVTRDILEEQKHANVELQMTLDRVKCELDEQRSLQSGVPSRPGSLPGSLSQSVGAELKKAMAAGEFSEVTEPEGQVNEGDEAQIDRIVKKLNEGLGGDQDDIYEEIRIKRIKRRQFRNRSGTIVESSGASTESDAEEIDEEIVELQDASTDTADLIPTTSRQIQTEAAPEPPPLYRPKTEELQVQTEPLVVGRQRDEIEELVEGVDIEVLREAIARIGRERAMGPVTRQGGFFSRLGLSQTIMNAIGPLNPYTSGTGGTSEGRVKSNAQFRLWSAALMLIATGCVIGQLVLPSTNPRPAMMVVEFIKKSAGTSATTGTTVGDVHGTGVSAVMGSKVWVEFCEVGKLGWDDMFLAHQITNSYYTGGIWGWSSLAGLGSTTTGTEFSGGLSGGVWRKVYEFGIRVLWDGIEVAKRVSTH